MTFKSHLQSAHGSRLIEMLHKLTDIALEKSLPSNYLLLDLNQLTESTQNKSHDKLLQKTKKKLLQSILHTETQKFLLRAQEHSNEQMLIKKNQNELIQQMTEIKNEKEKLMKYLSAHTESSELDMDKQFDRNT
eukprot:UN25853